MFGVVIFKLKGLGRSLSAVFLFCFKRLVEESLAKIWTTAVTIRLINGLGQAHAKQLLKSMLPFIVTSGHFKS